MGMLVVSFTIDISNTNGKQTKHFLIAADTFNDAEKELEKRFNFKKHKEIGSDLKIKNKIINNDASSVLIQEW